MATLPMDPRRLRLLQQRIFAYDMPGGIPSVPPSLRPLCAAGWFFGQSLDDRGLMVLDDLHQGTPRPVQPGRCANFDGVDDYIDCGDVGDPGTGSQTISAWIKYSGTAVQAVITKNDNAGGVDGRWGFYIEATTAKPYIFVYVNSLSSVTAKSTTGLNDGNWHLWTGVIDRTNGVLLLYVDSVQVASASLTGLAGQNIASSIPLRFGRDTGGNYFTGKIFDARIYNRALTDSEVSAIYNTSKPGGRPDVAMYPGNLVGHWKLDDGLRRYYHATVAYDSSGNGYHGAVANSSASFHYEGADVPFSWQNEVGYTPESQAAYALKTDLWTPKFDEWTAAGTDAKAVALTAQSWAGRTGLYAVKFLSGALAGYSANRVRTGADDFTAAGSKLYAVVADIALSRPLVGSEAVRLYFTGGEAGPYIDLSAGYNATLGDVTKFQTFTGPTTVFAASRTQSFTIYPPDAVTGGDLTVYVDNVKYLDMGAGTDAGAMEGRYYGERLPQKSTVPSVDVLGNVLTYTGPAPRNAKLIDSFCGTFDGVDDRATATDAADVTRFNNGVDDLPFSVAFLANFTPGNLRTVVSRGGTTTNQFEWGVLLDQTGKVTVGLYSTVGDSMLGVITLAAPFASGWHHCVFTYDGSKTNAGMKVYVDGVLAAVATVNNSGSGAYSGMNYNGNTLHIGQFADASYRFPGAIVDLRIYNSALSAADIALLFEGKTIAAAPVGHWPIQEGNGAILYDVSGNGLHATLTGATLGTFWGARQSNVHRNIRRGFRLDGSVRIPANPTGGAADGNAINRPAGVYHNEAETRIDFRGDTSASPWQEGLSPPSAYNFGDAVSGLMRKGTVVVEGQTRENNFYLLKE